MIALLLLTALAALAWWMARAKARAFSSNGSRAASLPEQHGWHAAIWAILPAAVVLLVWQIAEPALVWRSVASDPIDAALPRSAVERAAELHWHRIGIALALLCGAAGAAWSWARSRPSVPRRRQVEWWVAAALLAASTIAIVTTLGITTSLLVEAFRFFSLVSPLDFVFGAHWSPQEGTGPSGHGAFGAVPLFWGTIFIGAIIAMAVAVPLGLMTAVWLTQYARPATRRWAKPAVELLAGIPTVVYGYFAAITVAPALRELGVAIGIPDASGESALAAGLVMGIMIVPFVSSMADDSLAAVPQDLRDASLALGATPSETIRRVLLPAALPGVVGGVLLAVSRAIGETMIVVMAAGLAANLSANPFASVTTVTAQIVQLLTGDQEFDSPRTLAAFALGLMLFLVTLALNLVALAVVRRYRQAYD